MRTEPRPHTNDFNLGVLKCMRQFLEILGVIGDAGRADDVGTRGSDSARNVGGAEGGKVATVGNIRDGTVIRECGLEVIDAESKGHDDDYEERSVFGRRAVQKVEFPMPASLVFCAGR